VRLGDRPCARSAPGSPARDFRAHHDRAVRHVRIPCRYVSGYRLSRSGKTGSPEGRLARVGGSSGARLWMDRIRPDQQPDRRGAPHPRRHRTPITPTLPPTKGVFKGDSSSQLTVSVRVAPSDAPASAGAGGQCAAGRMAGRDPAARRTKRNSFCCQQQHSSSRHAGRYNRGHVPMQMTPPGPKGPSF